MVDGAGTNQQPEVYLTDQGELHLNISRPQTADQVVFWSDLRALARKVERHRPWARQEILPLLEDAANVGMVSDNLEKGVVILKRAADIYHRDMQLRNRLRYVLGTAIGVVTLVILAGVAAKLSAWHVGMQFADPNTIISLFAFAGIGSVTSVLTRLSTLEMDDETSTGMLLLSGASKPLVAIVFAGVVYIAMRYKPLNISFGYADTNSKTADAVYVVVAFLCGFSERFASDIIARLEPSRDPSNGDAHPRRR